ncbi:histidine phosphatase family protein [Nocardia sp. NBC_01499]|uniref:histidine phosphatase family protein n=1 Tax=Nocardia sp. NBC_01499 TaxID=2903597 RepID=UPI00386DF80A
MAHPESTHHVDGLVGGWYDSQLTTAGSRAAASIAQALRAKIPEQADVELFSSDLQRASQAATVIGDVLEVKPVLDRRLREKSYGEAEGKPQEWLNQRFVPPPAVGVRMRHDEGVSGSETIAAFAHRVYAAMDAIGQSACEHQIIVTHGGAITFAVASWARLPVESLDYVRFQAASGSITELREDDYFHNRQVVSLGDTRHLVAEP